MIIYLWFYEYGPSIWANFYKILLTLRWSTNVYSETSLLDCFIIVFCWIKSNICSSSPKSLVSMCPSYSCNDSVGCFRSWITIKVKILLVSICVCSRLIWSLSSIFSFSISFSAILSWILLDSNFLLPLSDLLKDLLFAYPRTGYPKL